MTLVFLNERVVDSEEAKIHPADAGLLHGMGLFETIRVYNGRPFRLEDHLTRLLNSAERLGLPITRTAAEMADAVYAVIGANKLVDARVRLTVTRGPVRPEQGADQPLHSTLLVSGIAESGYPAELYTKGMSVAVASIRVNPTDPMASHKTLNYWPRLMTLQAAREKHCGEALWFTLDGHLAEGCISNVFVVRDGKLITPPLDTPVLAGVTRSTVIEVARADNIEVLEEPITSEELFSAEEVLLSSSVMEVVPVVLIERVAIGDGKPGPLSRAVWQLYRQRVMDETGEAEFRRRREEADE